MVETGPDPRLFGAGHLMRGMLEEKILNAGGRCWKSGEVKLLGDFDSLAPPQGSKVR